MMAVSCNHYVAVRRWWGDVTPEQAAETVLLRKHGGDWEGGCPCPNCGDTSPLPCVNCATYGAHGGPCLHVEAVPA